MEKNLENAVVRSLISFYNAKTGSNINSNVDTNQEIVSAAIETADGDLTAIKTHIKGWVAANGPEDYPDGKQRFRACFAEVPKAEVLPSGKRVSDSLNILENAVADVIAKTQAEKIKESIMDKVQDEVRSFIKNEYGTIERKVITVIDGKERPASTEFVHEKFDTVLKFVANDIPVFLTGPAGSGKNHICKQVAQALGLKFYFSNAVTQEYKLTGFTDANGNYQETQFYKAFTEGGLFMLDEIDASIPEVLVILNAALANRYFDFPAPIGYREAHPNFKVVAAGNTTGHGADYDYVGRNQLDGASLDRFALVKIDYSQELENKLAGNNALADFCRAFRKASQKVGVNIIVSYRAIEHLAKMVNIMSLDEALQTCLVKDLEKDDLNIITKELTDNQYKVALNKICNGM